jgi:hypothetical protein
MIGPSYDDLVDLIRRVEEQTMAEPKRRKPEYVKGQRQFMSDGRVYDTHNPFHYIERWGVATWAMRKAGRNPDLWVGVFKETPKRCMMAVIASRGHSL